MNLQQQLVAEWEQIRNVFQWSERLVTIGGDRVCMCNITPCHHTEHGYPYIAIIDFGTEIGIETYNENGEWNVGVIHPLNIVLKKPTT